MPDDLIQPKYLQYIYIGAGVFVGLCLWLMYLGFASLFDNSDEE